MRTQNFSSKNTSLSADDSVLVVSRSQPLRGMKLSSSTLNFGQRPLLLISIVSATLKCHLFYSICKLKQRRITTARPYAKGQKLGMKKLYQQ
ncbi:hypothetical protein GBAR_LOCUS30806 [Geodia barretti]|uniref:Uncharacterized protein n=1 Tax=Geodia barretti TaxID=519541 RepID=A0AA35TYE3_GEOBA|nr:hypothetical protein GBAR_LOCUS30806 [Geodia barretti]